MPCLYLGGGGALDASVDWAGALSLGEQQRLAWARLLLAVPRLALLDEATSALDQATEEELYQVGWRRVWHALDNMSGLAPQHVYINCS